MAFWRFAALVLLALTAASARIGSKDINDDAEKYLLPWNIRPEHYDLTLITNIENFDLSDESSFRYSGINEITLLVLYGDVNEVVLHTYDDMNIVSAQVVSLDLGGSLNHTVTIGSYDSETNKQTFQVSPSLSNNGRYRLTIYFNGHNSDRLKGFYRSSYDDNGTKRWLVTTHFESFGARQAFPSFDEPEYKATYKLTVHYNQTLADAGYRAFFNTEVESEQIVNGVHVTTFKKTPRPLSTYLVAFIVAPFSKSPEPAYFNSSFNGGVALKPLWTIGQPKYFTPKRTDLLSQVAAPAALNQMTKFTSVGFGMDKVEQAGIPDFGPGAMENWGLVTYRESAVFWDNETGTTSAKQSVVSTTTHELAHQWFGDLVTLHWWSDVWLNEGFATYFAAHASNEFREPDLDTSDWNLLGKFVTGTVQNALKTDGQPNSRALTAESYIPDVIDHYFDGISYDKGGSILRMWRNIIGADNFYNGLNRYLRQQEESVGTPEILLASWDGTIDALPPIQRPDLSGRSVAELFGGWHLQAGYPVVNVARNGAELSLSQKRFLSAPGDDSSRWNVPITYSTDLEPNFKNTAPVAFLLAADDTVTITIKNAAANWVVVNNQESGFYRVNYDQDNWEKLLAIVNDPNQSSQIDELNRAQILDDSNALAGSTHESYLPYSTALEMLGMMRHEESTSVWQTALRVMKDLLNHFNSQSSFAKETRQKLKEYFLEIVSPMFHKLTLYSQDSDSHATKILRARLSDFACEHGLSACLEQAGRLYYSDFIHPDVRQVVFCLGVRQGSAAEWHKSFEQAVKSESPVKEDRLLALACTADEQLLDELLKMLSEDNLSSDESTIMMLHEILRRHPEKAAQVIDVIQNRSWKSPKTISTIKVNALSLLSTRDIQNFAQDPDFAMLKDTITSQKLWMDSKGAEIEAWLRKRL